MTQTKNASSPRTMDLPHPEPGKAVLDFEVKPQDKTGRDYSGARAAWALAVSQLRTMWSSKLVWLAAAASGIHIAVRLGIIVFVAVLIPEEFLSIFNQFFFVSAIAGQAFPYLIVGAVVGAGAASRDRMLGGLEFLLSKSLPPWGYVVGRVAAPTVAALALMFLPLLIFDLLLIALVPNLPSNSSRIMWGALGLGLLYAIVLGPLPAGIGTLLDNPRKATAAWLAAVSLTLPFPPIASEMGVEWFWAFSPVITVQFLGQTFMGIPFPTSGIWFAWVLVGLYVTLPMAALWWRTREVVR